MTDGTDLLTAPATPDVGHPVRSFVAVLVVAAIGLLALQWSGALWPHLSSGLRGLDTTGLDASRTGERIDVRNDGGLTVRVRAVDWPSRDLADPAVELIGRPAPDTVDFAQRRPAIDFEIPPGETVTLVLSGVAGCHAAVGSPRLHVDSWLGPDRTVELTSGQDGLSPLSLTDAAC